MRPPIRGGSNIHKKIRKTFRNDVFLLGHRLKMRPLDLISNGYGNPGLISTILTMRQTQ